MYFQIFHDLAQYAALNPEQFESVSVELLDKFIEEQGREVTTHDRNSIIYCSDSDSTRIQLF